MERECVRERARQYNAGKFICVFLYKIDLKYLYAKILRSRSKVAMRYNV